MKRDTNTRVDVEIAIKKTSDSRDEPIVQFQVMDRLSSTAIVEIEITPAQFLAALSGSYLGNIPGWVTPRPERIGKQMKHREVIVPAGVIDGLAYRGPEREQAVREWGKAQAEPGEDVETRNTNSGWRVIFRRYEEVQK